MENLVALVALTFSISALFLTIITTNVQQQNQQNPQQQIVMVNSNLPPKSSESDFWILALIIVLGAMGVIYMLANG